jgi:hypothetical protein
MCAIAMDLELAIINAVLWLTIPRIIAAVGPMGMTSAGVST